MSGWGGGGGAAGRVGSAWRVGEPRRTGRLSASAGCCYGRSNLISRSVESGGMGQIGPIVDKQTVRRHINRYKEEEYPDRSGPDLSIGQCETTLVRVRRLMSVIRAVENRREFVTAGL
jgi:hypothetical protein